MIEYVFGFTKFLTVCKNIGTVINFKITTKQSLCDKYDVHIQDNKSKNFFVVT